ncbi:MAG: hypothetical protein PHT07_21160 [Paludibacter sp.]|nr:hypothetical protein [Paludibacter sp.]
MALMFSAIHTICQSNLSHPRIFKNVSFSEGKHEVLQIMTTFSNWRIGWRWADLPRRVDSFKIVSTNIVNAVPIKELHPSVFLM